MVLSKRPPRSILKRRGSISTAVQTLLDLMAVLGLAILLIRQQIGETDGQYSVLLLLLAIGMVFAYDQFGVYRSNSSFARKALTLFKAWSLAFAFLLVVGFATKQTDAYSRLLLAQLFGAGLPFAGAAALLQPRDPDPGHAPCRTGRECPDHRHR
jgi:putative colanic acid biosysnthesis UDP-glucose lipid carrier transferase